MGARKRPKVLPRQRAPVSIERAYTAKLRAVVKACRAPVAAAVARLAKEKRDDAINVGLTCSVCSVEERYEFGACPSCSRVTIVDGNATAVTRALAGVSAQFDTVVKKAKPGLLAQGVGKTTTAFASKAADDVVRGVVTIPAQEVAASALIKSFVSENVALIKSIPQVLLGDVESVIAESWRIGRSTADIERHIAERFGVADRRARLIARDQIATLNGKVTAARHKQIGIAEYEWSTSNDERVRGDPGGLYPKAKPSHHARDGKVFRYSKPPDGGHPGEAINCRCVAVPVIPDDLE